MRRRAIITVGVATVLAASVALVTKRGVTDGQSPEPRWGRAQITGDPEHWGPNRADWSDEPDQWELRRVADVREIPLGVRDALEPLDCAIPSYRSQSVDQSVVWGEFEHAGQRDLAVLCVHSDKTSATYIFWAADPARREVVPTSGSGINADPRERVQQRLDPDSPLEPDMPATVEHDGLEIGCCECCSAIYYRHGGQWFTLPGAD